MKPLIVFMLLGILICVTAKAQNQKPFSQTYNLKKNNITPNNVLGKSIVFEEGKEKTFDNLGVWETLADGSRVWRARICLKGAKGVGFAINELKMPKNARLYAYNPSRTFEIMPFVQADFDKKREQHKGLGITGVQGEELILEYNEPAQNNDFEAILSIKSFVCRFADFPMSAYENITDSIVWLNPIIKIERDHFRENLKLANEKQVAFGYGRPLKNVNLQTQGKWTNIPNKGRIWRLGIEIDFAESMMLSFTGNFPEGSYLHTYHPEKKYVSPPYDATILFENQLHLRSDNKIIIEYFEPLEQKDKSKLEILRFDIDPNYHWLGMLNQDCITPCSPNIVQTYSLLY